MLLYKYVARNTTTGERITSQVQADSVANASKLIQDQGLAPIDIKLVDDANTALSRFTKKVKTKDKVIFSRQLATLIAAGLPLVQSLRNVFDQMTNKAFKAVISQVISDVESGKQFSEALAKHPMVFDAVFINLIGAGEVSGTLEESLERLANQQEKDAEIISKVRSAMVYPVIVLVVMIAVVTFMLITVLPQVEQLYEGLDGAGDLPFITRILLSVSQFLATFWWVFLGLLAFGIFMGSRWVKTAGGREFVDRFKLKVWPVAPLFQKLYMARFARIAATMVGSGVPLIQTLEVVAKAVNNVLVKRSVEEATEKVKGGKALSEALRNDPHFLSLVPDMLHIGEESGQMEGMLNKTADYYEKEVDTQIRTISTIIEPVLIIMLGIAALIIVAAILLPIYGLATRGVLR